MAKSQPLLIQEYNPQWASEFQAIQKIIMAALVDLPVSIEHIGSTAIPGLAAKPIIDIDIVMQEHTAFDTIKDRLATIGYNHHGNQGIPGREVFKRAPTAAVQEVLDGVAHHLYVCPANSEELQRHLRFRDYLLTHEDARIQYEQLKYAIAEEVNQDRKQYAALKEIKATVFITDILEKAGLNKL
ncbi:MAG: GrpB family protein [Chitinophagales bacterium]|nr:GrpB family protein [Chitinophagales bacterium]